LAEINLIIDEWRKENKDFFFLFQQKSFRYVSKLLKRMIAELMGEDIKSYEVNEP
jgi:hypothetical protein